MWFKQNNKLDLSSIGVATKLASITAGALTELPSNAIASTHRKKVTPVERVKMNS